MVLQEMIDEAEAEGYSPLDARAKISQDVILKAISSSGLIDKAAIKGGVVMRSITGNIRRATQDLDIDFIRYSLSDESIEEFIRRINCIDGIAITRNGDITELKQQDYKGKRIYVSIEDSEGTKLESKIDLGVHKRLEIKQEEYCFDIARDIEGASLLINSKEQIFIEKLCSLLKFGSFNTRYKDIYDIYYLSDKMNKDELIHCINTYVINNLEMREETIEEIVTRVKHVFDNKIYKSKVDSSDKKWLDTDIDDVFEAIIQCLENLIT